MLLFASQFEGVEVLLGSLVFSSCTGQAVNDTDVKVTCLTLLMWKCHRCMAGEGSRMCPCDFTNVCSVTLK